jgi:hypothetical protein
MMNKSTFKQRFGYWFDNMMAKGTPAMILLLALGYRLAAEAKDAKKDYGVHTNPKKSAKVIFSPEDRIIVVAEE